MTFKQNYFNINTKTVVSRVTPESLVREIFKKKNILERGIQNFLKFNPYPSVTHMTSNQNNKQRESVPFSESVNNSNIEILKTVVSQVTSESLVREIFKKKNILEREIQNFSKLNINTSVTHMTSKQDKKQRESVPFSESISNFNIENQKETVNNPQTVVSQVASESLVREIFKKKNILERGIQNFSKINPNSSVTHMATKQNKKQRESVPFSESISNLNIENQKETVNDPQTVVSQVTSESLVREIFKKKNILEREIQNFSKINPKSSVTHMATQQNKKQRESVPFSKSISNFNIENQQEAATFPKSELDSNKFNNEYYKEQSPVPTCGSSLCNALINRTRRVVFIDSSRNEKSSYYVFYVSKAKLVKITKNDFLNLEGKFFCLNKHKIKFIGMDNLEIKRLISIVDFSCIWKAQGRFHDLLTGAKLFIKTCEIFGKASKIAQKYSFVITTFIASISKLVYRLTTSTDGDVIGTIIGICIEAFISIVSGLAVRECWKAQGVSSAALATASMFLPKELFEICRRMSVFSNAKLLDDASQMFSFYSLCLDFFKRMMNYLPFELPAPISSILNLFFDVEGYNVLHQAKNILERWRADKHLMLNNDFRNSIEETNKKIQDSLSLSEWSKRSPSVNSLLLDFKNLMKSCDAYNSCSRVEPCLFVFEGPPGTLKSVKLNNVVQVLNDTVYNHIIKTSHDGKDFYDSYNNENIYVADDVGQMGIDQWRSMINMIAPIKLPLDCANSKLKDTKFFNSEIVMVTTNSFTKLSGLCKGDGISDLSALWRRGYVFDFSGTQRDGRDLIGTVQFQYYDTNSNCWKKEFPRDFKNYMEENDLKIESYCSADCRLVLTAWFTVIIQNFHRLKKDQMSSNQLPETDVQTIRHLVKTAFKSESFSAMFKAREMGNFLLDTYAYMGDLVSSCYEYIIPESISDFVTTKNFTQFCTIAGGISLVCCIYGAMKRLKDYFVGEGSLRSTLTDDPQVSRHPTVSFIQKQIFEIDFSNTDNTEKLECMCLVSGRHLLLPHHINPDKQGFITVYKSRDKNHILIDKMLVKAVYRNVAADLCVWELPSNYPTPFKSLVKHIGFEETQKPSILAHAYGALDINTINALPVDYPTPYDIVVRKTKIVNYINNKDIFYSVHQPGMCGSVVISQCGKILGMHVAGNSKSGVGVAIKWSKEVIQALHSTVSNSGLHLLADISSKEISNFSGIKLDHDFNVFTPKNSSFIESPLYNVFPVTRKPANLSVYGPHTVKDISKKSFLPVADVPLEELEFGQKVLKQYIYPFADLPMKEVLLGNDLIAPINKKSSNGLFCPKTKEECIDYATGSLKEPFKTDYENFLKVVDSGEINLQDVVWFETLKDELRDESKITPRSFRVSRLHMQILTKSIFGNMVKDVVENRDFNQIMIGINPFKQWEQLYNRLKEKDKFAGDIKSWDGCMLPQVQQAVCEVLSDLYTGEHKNRLLFILGMIPYCVVAVNDDTYLTTHSMPSGSFLTAVLNSIVNRFYTTMWYFRNVKIYEKPTVKGYMTDILDFVYGDDKLNAILTESRKPYLNALTMRDFFLSINMDFTTSDKKTITEKFQQWPDITFLKRSFTYHTRLKQVVGPLSLSTVLSSLSWVDSTKDLPTVLQDKISASQREMFLHEELFKPFIITLEKGCAENSIPLIKLPEPYLINLYNNGEYPYAYDVGDIIV